MIILTDFIGVEASVVGKEMAKKLNFGAKIQTVNKQLNCKQTAEIINKQLKL